MTPIAGRSKEELEADGAQLGPSGVFSSPDGEWLPLYEGKMIHQYDHRFGTYEGQTQEQANQNKLPEASSASHADPDYWVLAKYWVEAKDTDRRSRGRSWHLCFRDVTSSTNARTGLFSALPRVGANHKLPLLESAAIARLRLALLANLNTFVLDYIMRQKVGGSSLGFYILRQVPVVPPMEYSEEQLALIVPRVLELVYTSHSMTPLARDVGCADAPYRWDDSRRMILRAELEGIYAHFMGVGREDLEYIIDTFRKVAEDEIEVYHEFRSKRLALEAFDHFSPETLRALELDLRDIEHRLRRTVTRTLSNDATLLPRDIRDVLLEERGKQRPGEPVPDDLSLRELLESSYLRHLSTIVRSADVWPRLQPQFDSKSQFEKHFGRLNTFRNPLVHGRGVDEDIRRKGEEAIAWFRQRLT